MATSGTTKVRFKAGARMFLFATEDPVQLVTGIPTPALELTIHLYLALRLRISGALSPLPYTLSWRSGYVQR